MVNEDEHYEIISVDTLCMLVFEVSTSLTELQYFQGTAWKLSCISITKCHENLKRLDRWIEQEDLFSGLKITKVSKNIKDENQIDLNCIATGWRKQIRKWETSAQLSSPECLSLHPILKAWTPSYEPDNSYPSKMNFRKRNLRHHVLIWSTVDK